jgi:ParB/RepB/Spo0J family partition protein
MSSFKAKVARSKKEKEQGVQQSSTASGKGSGRKKEEAPVTEDTSLAVVEEQEVQPAAAPTESTTIAKEEPEQEALYGEDQEDQSKPKWQREIPIDRIRPNPFQPRKTFDPVKLDELAAGMKEHGWVGGGLPVRAAPDEANTYELVFGERRWRAARIAELKTIPCVVSIYTDEDMIEKGLLENIQREDLTNLEEGQAYVNLLALRTEQEKPRYSIRRLAQRIGKDKSYIEERLKYARVPIDIQQLAADQPDISPRIIHELGELAKLLSQEERAPVVEGVREGKLRIEDVREIRKDVEEQVKQETPATTTLPVGSAPVEAVSAPSPIEQEVEEPTRSTDSQVSVATDTSDTPPPLIQEEQPAAVSQERSTPDTIVPSSESAPITSAPVAPAPASPLASAVAVSVFEKTLKRDNEAMERIFQRISTAIGSLTEPEERVLRHFLKRWSDSIQEFVSRLEPEEAP